MAGKLREIKAASMLFGQQPLQPTTKTSWLGIAEDQAALASAIYRDVNRLLNNPSFTIGTNGLGDMSMAAGIYESIVSADEFMADTMTRIGFNPNLSLAVGCRAVLFAFGADKCGVSIQIPNKPESITFDWRHLALLRLGDTFTLERAEQRDLLIQILALVNVGFIYQMTRDSHGQNFNPPVQVEPLRRTRLYCTPESLFLYCRSRNIPTSV